MQKRIVVVALVAVLTLGIGQGVLAFGPGFGPSGTRGGRSARFGTQVTNELGLTAEQQKQLSELRLQHLEQTKDLRSSQEKLRIELQSLWSAESLDAEAIAAKEGELAKTRVKLVELNRKAQKEAETVYTDEQLEKLEAQPWRQMNRRYGQGGGMGMRQRGFSRNCIY
jgi:Spy/CpxP family protein refolding chaperone